MDYFQGDHCFSFFVRKTLMHFLVVGHYQIYQSMCVCLCSYDLGGGNENDLNLGILTLHPSSIFHKEFSTSLSSSLSSSSWDTFSWSLQLAAKPYSEFLQCLWVLDIHLYMCQRCQWTSSVRTEQGLTVFVLSLRLSWELRIRCTE